MASAAAGRAPPYEQSLGRLRRRRSTCQQPHNAGPRPQLRRRGPAHVVAYVGDSNGALPAAPASAAAAALAAAGPTASRAPNGTTHTKLYDVVALSNLCVDVVVSVPELPPEDEASRRQLLVELMAQSATRREDWEVGGNTNFLISAARIGLRAASVGHIGPDVYGRFLTSVLADEGVHTIEPVARAGGLGLEHETLLCFVLLAPGGSHGFCSRYDLGPWPMLPFVRSLAPGVRQTLQQTRALFINGFAFDELPSKLVLEAARTVQEAGGSVLFDPGPRSWTFQQGARREALQAMLDLSDVLLMTEEEGQAVTGLAQPEAQATFVLGRPGSRTEWCVVKQGAAGALLASRQADQMYQQEALRVDVRDTVGCGDSFAAAVVLGFCRGHSISETLALANAVGAATAMGQGAGRNVATAAAVRALLAERLPCSTARSALQLLDSSLDSYNGWALSWGLGLGPYRAGGMSSTRDD